MGSEWLIPHWFTGNSLTVCKVIASHAGVFRELVFHPEKRAPLKTPAWEASKASDQEFPSFSNPYL